MTEMEEEIEIQRLLNESKMLEDSLKQSDLEHKLRLQDIKDQKKQGLASLAEEEKHNEVKVMLDDSGGIEVKLSEMGINLPENRINLYIKKQ